jgi:hypothetical protein
MISLTPNNMVQLLLPLLALGAPTATALPAPEAAADSTMSLQRRDSCGNYHPMALGKFTLHNNAAVVARLCYTYDTNQDRGYSQCLFPLMKR